MPNSWAIVSSAKKYYFFYPRRNKLKKQQDAPLLHSKLILDKYYWDVLENLALREGIVIREHDLYGGDIVDTGFESVRLYRKSELLRYITLYESVDSQFSKYDLAPLVDSGLVDIDSNIASGGKVGESSLDVILAGDEELAQFVKKGALDIMSTHKIRLYEEYTHRHPSETGRQGEWRSKSVKKSIDDILDGQWDEALTVAQHGYHEGLVETVVHPLRALTRGLLESAKHQSTFLTKYNYSEVDSRINSKALRDVYCLVRTQLTDEILVLPKPRNLEEALAMREQSDLVQFRQVLQEWIDVLREGRWDVESRIRADLGKANRALSRKNQLQRFQKSPINFWVSAIGGHVPIFSNVITLASTASSVYQKWAEKKYSWVLADWRNSK